ncbi:hypothetical protein [Lactococcus fujiensis]|nr:hypothetical protein [Lactococcus fujiensis]
MAGQLLNLPTVDNHYMELGQEAFQLAISKEVKQVSIDSNFYPSRPTT